MKPIMVVARLTNKGGCRGLRVFAISLITIAYHPINIHIMLSGVNQMYNAALFEAVFCIWHEATAVVFIVAADA